MKIQLLSDLHLEFRHGKVFDDTKAAWSIEPEWRHFLRSATCDKPGETILVLAGDILPLAEVDGGRVGPQFAADVFAQLTMTYKKVVYVLGNHEYYGASSWAAVKDVVKTLQTLYPNLAILQNDVVTIEGQRFIGGTMWYRPIRDHHLIPGCWTPVYTENANFRRLLESEVKPTDIVVTHHLPSMHCVPDKFKLSPSNGYFVCEMDQFIEKRQPKLWCFGHTHSSVNFSFDNTRILANPAGYPGERKDWDPKLMVQVYDETVVVL